MDENAASAPSESSTKQWNTLQKRIATSLVMVAVTLPILWYGEWLLTAFVMLVAFQMNREWEHLIPSKEWYWRVAGVAYILIPCISLLLIRNLSFLDSAEASFYATLYPILLIAAVDSCAYFSGRIIGGPKLAPTISPNKTWAGLIGGMFGAIIVALLMLPLVPWPETHEAAITIAVCITLLSQGGDLFESWLKRSHDVKDSGNLLPGHGGLLDRLDGYVFTLPVYYLWLITYAELIS